ncbi:MAG TPA: hypothetical protein PK530_11000 [Anaerolineales bacterium]|nr:hypothetical protein [Anaerolineales bacterium]
MRQMAEENRLWGAERIRGVLLKLGIKVAKRTLQKYLPKERHPIGKTWTTFLKNHAQEIFVCDFTVIHDLCFRPIYLLVVMHLATRQIKHFNLTRNPTDAWMAYQMREISVMDKDPRFFYMRFCTTAILRQIHPPDNYIDGDSMCLGIKPGCLSDA